MDHRIAQIGSAKVNLLNGNIAIKKRKKFFYKKLCCLNEVVFWKLVIGKTEWKHFIFFLHRLNNMDDHWILSSDQQLDVDAGRKDEEEKK